MKIAFIGQKGIPSTGGGIEKHVEDLAVALVQSGHEVFAYTRPHYTDPSLTEFKGVRLISLPSLVTKNLDAISHTFLAAIDVLRRDVDIIHFHGIGPSSLVWLVKLLKPRSKVVATFHCKDYFHQKWSLLGRLYLKFGEFVACRIADRTIAVSRSLAAYTLERYHRRAMYIPNGVHLMEAHGSDKIAAWGLEKGGYIVAVSRLIRHKGFHYLIDAYRQLDTDKKLVIVGEGSFTDDYVHELKVMAAGDSRVIMTGAQSGETLHQLFANAYLFVQPSESEGLSIALLEAMAHGSAPLVSDIPENTEAIGQAGFSFRSGDADDLVAQLRCLLESPSLVRTIGSQARRRVSAEYDWRTIAASVEQLYGQLVGDSVGERLERRKLAARFTTFL